jgi:hypothetical protein
MVNADPPAYIALLRIAAVVAGYVATFVLVRRWPRLILSLLAIAAIIGFGLLIWAWFQGISALPGQLVGTPEVKSAFLVGFPLAVMGSALFFVCLIPRHPRLNDGTTKSFVGDLLLRLLAMWIVSAIIGIIAYTLVTGYSK